MGRQPQRGGARRRLEQRPTHPELGLTDTVGQQTIMPNPLEAAGQDMEEEPPKKLDCVQRHRPVAIPVGRVFPAKRHPPVLECQQAAICDRHAMGIAREILQHRPRAAEGWVGLHHPLGGPEGAQELLPPCGVSEGIAVPL